MRISVYNICSACGAIPPHVLERSAFASKILCPLAHFLCQIRPSYPKVCLGLKLEKLFYWPHARPSHTLMQCFDCCEVVAQDIQGDQIRIHINTKHTYLLHFLYDFGHSTNANEQAVV